MADMNGVSIEDHLGRTLREVLPNLADTLEPVFLNILRTGVPVLDYDIEGETPAQPGVTRFWKASYHPNRDADGDIAGLLFVIREVTEEVRMEGALAESETRLSMALESTGLGVWDWTLETGRVWFSDKWQTMLGFDPGEVWPHISNWEETVHPDDWPAVNAALEPHLAGLTPHYECEHRVRCKDGQWLWILDRGKVVQRAKDGSPLRMVGTHDNIDSRKKDQLYRAALLELQRDLSELDSVGRMEDRTLAVCLKTLDVDFVALTELGEWLGHPRIVRRWRDGSSGMSQGRWIGGALYKEFGRRMAKGESVSWPDIAREPFMADVRDIPSEWPTTSALMGVPMMRHDRLIGTILVGSVAPHSWTARQMEFLTDASNAAREAIARAKAGEANQQAQEELQRIGRLNSLSALTSTLAHELNQPLAAASNYLMAAKMQARRCTPSDIAPENAPEKVIELAAQQVVRAGEIIRRMRAFTQSGEVMARLASIAEAVDGAIETTLSSMRPRTLVIRKFYAEELPDVLLDTVQFQQVISNLVRNAIEAMEGAEKTELGVTIRLVGKEIIVEVTDTGHGFAAGVLETLFQPFHSEKRRGLGLGLPICRTIIEAHGGKITGEAREGGGALFRISLPVPVTL